MTVDCCYTRHVRFKQTIPVATQQFECWDEGARRDEPRRACITWPWPDSGVTGETRSKRGSTHFVLSLHHRFSLQHKKRHVGMLEYTRKWSFDNNVLDWIAQLFCNCHSSVNISSFFLQASMYRSRYITTLITYSVTRQCICQFHLISVKCGYTACCLETSDGAAINILSPIQIWGAVGLAMRDHRVSWVFWDVSQSGCRSCRCLELSINLDIRNRICHIFASVYVVPDDSETSSLGHSPREFKWVYIGHFSFQQIALLPQIMPANTTVLPGIRDLFPGNWAQTFTVWNLY